MTLLRAAAAAAAAQTWLERAGGSPAPPARVLSVFSQACNLVAGDGAVLALVTAARGLTPFGLVVESEARQPFAGVEQTSAVSVQPGMLRVGPLEIDYAGAAAWDARPDWAAVEAALKAHRRQLDDVTVSGLEAAPDDSLLRLWYEERETKLFVRVRPAAQDLIGGLKTGDWARAEQGIRKLAGLGGGLTPAGDDFALGVFLAAHAGAFGPAAVEHCPALAEALAPRTNTLSAAYVRAAAQGECAAYWHDLLVALRDASDEAEVEISAAASALAEVGHTSGADALAGFLASFEPILA